METIHTDPSQIRDAQFLPAQDLKLAPLGVLPTQFGEKLNREGPGEYHGQSWEAVIKELIAAGIISCRLKNANITYETDIASIVER